MIKLIHGDCIEEMKKLPDNSVDLCLTDPPYGTTACKWDKLIPFESMWVQLKRIVKNNGAICLFGSEPFSSNLRMSNIKNYGYDWIWYKNTQTGMAFAKYQPMRSYECIIVFYYSRPNFYHQKMKSRTENIETLQGKTRSRRGGFKSDHLPNIKTYNISFSKQVNPRNVLEFNSVNNANGLKLVPTQKPVPLLEYLIKTYTLEKETVLDFTMGSGSTGVAAKNLSRKFIGIEKEKKYYDIAVGRVHE